MTWSAPLKLVSTRMPSGAPAARSRRMASMPSTPGITRSVSRTSGRGLDHPHGLGAVAGLADDREALGLEERAQALAHHRVVVADHHPDGGSAAARRRCPARSRPSRRDPQLDRGALAGRRRDRQPPAERRGPLVHRGQPEPAGPHGPRVGVEAPAVVDHPQHDLGRPPASAVPR